MNFGQKIKKLREDRKITQQQMADELNVSRQAVSNWENDRNLPDIEMLISISRTFHISLDELVLGGKEMNNMAEKLITDSRQYKRSSGNSYMAIIGTSALLLSIVSIIAKALNGSTTDELGNLIEPFFLLPVAALLFLFAMVIFIGLEILNTKDLISNKDVTINKSEAKRYLLLSTGVLLTGVGSIVLLILAVSGKYETSKVILSFLAIQIGSAFIVTSIVLFVIAKKHKKSAA